MIINCLCYSHIVALLKVVTWSIPGNMQGRETEAAHHHRVFAECGMQAAPQSLRLGAGSALCSLKLPEQHWYREGIRHWGAEPTSLDLQSCPLPQTCRLEGEGGPRTRIWLMALVTKNSESICHGSTCLASLAQQCTSSSTAEPTRTRLQVTGGNMGNRIQAPPSSAHHWLVPAS